ncbi:MAG: 50S ribosome-binding GTPase [Candidatus Wallbacteria bacterium]|nr:50S ribosome-binding GTPase [Candidatus Wallbacteria bacterium]
MATSWYPHHMKRTCEEIKKYSQIVDVFLFLMDARAPQTSLYPEFIPDKEKIVLGLNKSDLVDPEAIDKIIKRYKREYRIFPLNSMRRDSCRRLISGVRVDFRKKILYIMVVGLPNVGKSMFIRNLSGKKVKVGAEAGVTTQVSWLSCIEGVRLADTPGVLFPRIESDEVYARLCLINAVGERMMDYEKAGRWLLSFLTSHPERFHQRYGFEPGTAAEENIPGICDRMGLKPGDEKMFKLMVRDFQQGRFGKLVLDAE